jgi:tetratricopeptide (TPR) repeat protein
MYPQAMDYARKALDLQKSLHSLFGTPKNIDLLSFCYYQCYYICQCSGNEEEATAFLQKRVELLEAVPTKDLTRDLWLQLGNVYTDLAESMPMRKYLILPNRERIELLDKTLSIFFRLYTQNPDDDSAKRGVISIRKLQMEYLYKKIKRLWNRSAVDDVKWTSQIVKKIRLK